MSGTRLEPCPFAEPHRAHDWWPGGDQSQRRRGCPGVGERRERVDDRPGPGPEPSRAGRT